MNKISIIVSGGVSLCTYEVGVLTSLYQLFLENGDVDFEVIGGSSAGAISTFLFSSSLFKGFNPYFMADMIIENTDIKNLVSKHDQFVLDFDNLIPSFEKIFKCENRCEYTYGDSDCKKARCRNFCKDKRCSKKKNEQIKMVFNVTTLEPILKDIQDKVFSKNFTLRTHNLSFVLDFKSCSEKKIYKLLKASASFPIFFAPVRYIFENDDLKEFSNFYKDDKIELDLTDGGVTQNLPLKIIFNNIRESEKIILIIPHPDDPSTIIENAKNKRKLNIFDVIIKLLDSSFYQSYYSDLKLSFEFNRIEKKLFEIRNSLKSSFENLDLEEKKVVENFLNVSSLDLKNLDENLSTGKKIIQIDIISPQKPEEELAGEILNHFGGFFDKNLRYNDFLVGYFDGLKYCKNFGYDLKPLFDEKDLNKKIGNVNLKNLKNKKIIFILILKSFVSLLYPYRKNFLIIFLIFFFKSTIKFLEKFY